MSIQVTLLALAAECFAPVFASKRNIFLFLFWVLNFFRRFVGRSVSSIGQCALVGLSDDVGLVKKSWEIRFPGKPTLSPMFFQGADANLPILLAASAPPASCSAHWWKFGTLAGTRTKKPTRKLFRLLPLIQQAISWRRRYLPSQIFSTTSLYFLQPGKQFLLLDLRVNLLSIFPSIQQCHHHHELGYGRSLICLGHFVAFGGWDSGPDFVRQCHFPFGTQL